VLAEDLQDRRGVLARPVVQGEYCGLLCTGVGGRCGTGFDGRGFGTAGAVRDGVEPALGVMRGAPPTLRVIPPPQPLSSVTPATDSMTRRETPRLAGPAAPSESARTSAYARSASASSMLRRVRPPPVLIAAMSLYQHPSYRPESGACAVIDQMFQTSDR
jgi:hypothetical protein